MIVSGTAGQVQRPRHGTAAGVVQVHWYRCRGGYRRSAQALVIRYTSRNLQDNKD